MMFQRRAWAAATVLAAGLGGGSGLPACAPPTAPGLTAQLRADTGATWTVELQGPGETPDLLVPKEDPSWPRLRAGDDPRATALAFLDKYARAWRTDALSPNLRVLEVRSEPMGHVHVRLEQTYDGRRVLGAGLSVHFRPNGALAFVNGHVVPDLAVPHGPALGEARAIDIARSATGATGSATAELLVDPPRGSRPALAWLVAFGGSPTSLGGEEAMIDATTGEVRRVSSSVHTVAASGLGAHAYPPFSDAGDRKMFRVEKAQDAFVLARSGSVTETEVRVARADGSSLSSRDADDWDPLPADVNGRGTAVDAYYYVGEVDAFFRHNFDRASFDGAGGALSVVVHDNRMGAHNAFWDGRQIRFGSGDFQTGGLVVSPAALDIAAHELTHAVTQHTAHLAYDGESGALNESFSDVFACLAEHWKEPNERNNMLVGERTTSTGAPLRSMLHPRDGLWPQPDHTSAKQAVSGPPTKDNDWGGVHYNSGIPNNAFALMVVGGRNDTSRVFVPPGGWASAREVWWAALRDHDRETTNFETHARWMIAAAIKRELDPKPVACAWVATGVLTRAYVLDTWEIACNCAAPDGTTSCEARDGGVDVDGRAPDTCASKADGFYCSEVATYSGYACATGAIIGGQQCPGGRACQGLDADGHIRCR